MNASEAAEPRNLEAVFLDNLPLIDRLVTTIGRRNGLSQSDMEEFGSWFKARVIDRDYAVFRKYTGKASLPTYLTVVLVNAYKDYRNSRWGRWRPSAAAQRLGPLAVRLETLISRDGCPIEEAVTILEQAEGARSAEIRNLLHRINPRVRTREVDLDSTEGTLVASDAGSFWEDQVESARQAAGTILEQQLAGLDPEDQVIIRMRFWSGFTVAQIARALRIDQKRLYRRIDAIQSRLRESLTAAGLDGETVRQVLQADN